MRNALSSAGAALLLVSLAIAGGCRTDPEDDLRANVTLLVRHEGATAMAAADRLARHGGRAIVIIEAALHTANEPGRKNLVYALRRIGDAEAIPLLAHLAAHERSELVRREAEWTLRLWAKDPKEPKRGERAKAALRTLEEERGDAEAG